MKFVISVAPGIDLTRDAPHLTHSFAPASEGPRAARIVSSFYPPWFKTGPMSETFTASRLTQNNFFFPTRIEITPEHIVRIKPKIIGAVEESIAISKVASVQITKGLFFADIRIDSSGGTNPIESRGHTKGDAERIRALIETYQHDEHLA